MAFATAGTLAFLRGRDTRSGALLGLGAFVKLYPGLLAIPFALERLRAGAKDRAARLVAVTGGVWLVANLPFAILGFAGWVWFFRYNSRRPPDFDSLWEVLCHVHLCPPTPVVNIASVGLAAAGTWWSWRAAKRRSEGLPIWISAFPLLVMVLLTGKVWSSQYSLWLLPWFAVTSVPWFLFLEYQLAEVAEYLVRYHYFGTRDIRSWDLVLGARCDRADPRCATAALSAALGPSPRPGDRLRSGARRDRCGYSVSLSLACPRPREVRDQVQGGDDEQERAEPNEQRQIFERSSQHRAQEIRRRTRPWGPPYP